MSTSPTLSWDSNNTAVLAAYGLSFTVSDEHGEEPWQGFYWHEDTSNLVRGNFDTPDQAKQAAQAYVATQVCHTVFLIDVCTDDAIELGFEAGSYLIHLRDIPLMHADDTIHDGVDLVAALCHSGNPPPHFLTQDAVDRYVSTYALILGQPEDYGLL